MNGNAEEDAVRRNSSEGKDEASVENVGDRWHGMINWFGLEMKLMKVCRDRASTPAQAPTKP